MSIYKFDTYTEALEHLHREFCEQYGKITFAEMAASCLVQPSYLTNVFKGRADLNSDQLFRLCEKLKVSPEDYEYLYLLLEHKRTSYFEKKNYLSKKIRELQRNKIRAEKKISTPEVALTAEHIERYYLDPYIQIIHIYLSIPKVDKSVSNIAAKFGLPTAKTKAILDTLVDLKYAKKKQNQYKLIVSGKHLPRESPILRPHHQLMRLKSIDQMQKLGDNQVYSFSASISADEKARIQLQAEFVDFLKKAEKIVKTAPAENLYQINFDLFPWMID